MSKREKVREVSNRSRPLASRRELRKEGEDGKAEFPIDRVP